MGLDKLGVCLSPNTQYTCLPESPIVLGNLTPGAFLASDVYVIYLTSLLLKTGPSSRPQLVVSEGSFSWMIASSAVFLAQVYGIPGSYETQCEKQITITWHNMVPLTYTNVIGK